MSFKNVANTVCSMVYVLFLKIYSANQIKIYEPITRTVRHMKLLGGKIIKILKSKYFKNKLQTHVYIFTSSLLSVFIKSIYVRLIVMWRRMSVIRIKHK